MAQSAATTNFARELQLPDAGQLGPLFSQWSGRFEQLSCGPFRSRLRIVQGNLVRLIAIEANQRVLIQGRDQSNLLSVYPVSPGVAADVWQGRRLQSGQLVLLGAEGESNHCSARQVEGTGISLRPETLEAAARGLLAADLPLPPRTWTVLMPPPPAFASLTRHLERLLAQSFADATVLGSAEGRILEQECLRALVAALFADATRRTSPPLSTRAHCVRRAEELMRSRLTRPLGAIDLCHELGVSERTLRLAFRERYGLGPMAYYKRLRLNAVRDHLQSQEHLGVAAAARRFGFHHLGNFAADYRRLFGELPSATPELATAMPLPQASPAGHFSHDS